MAGSGCAMVWSPWGGLSCSRWAKSRHLCPLRFLGFTGAPSVHLLLVPMAERAPPWCNSHLPHAPHTIQHCAPWRSHGVRRDALRAVTWASHTAMRRSSLPTLPSALAGHRAHTPPGMDHLILHPCLTVHHQRCSSPMAISPGPPARPIHTPCPGPLSSAGCV